MDLIGKLQINWLDLLVLAIIVVYILEGYALGLLRSFLDFISFILSFLAAILFYSSVAVFLALTFSIPKNFANAIGFFLIAFLVEIILGFFLFRFILRLKVFSNLKLKLKPFKIEKFLGIIPGFLSAVVLLTFVLTLIIVLPVSPHLKKSISNSKIGSFLVLKSQIFEERLNSIFGQAVSDAMVFLTVEPQSNQALKLNFKTNNLSVDQNAEVKMLNLVNQERAKVGDNALIYDDKLTIAARNHCKDMFQRGYFSHYTPEGLSPFDRMGEADISFIYAGENLALAPNVVLAMQGLMNSKGHRENILSQNFAKVGIGVIDGGVYGEMFCQEFTD